MASEKPPELVTYLDFSKTNFKTGEELKAALWKVPDLKLRYDRLWDEEVLCKMKGEYTYPNPVPVALRPVRLRDLSQVEIDWRMMTLLRPNTKLEEDIFTRIVQMERYRLKMSKSAKSLIVKNPPRVGLTGVSRSSGPKEEDSSDESPNLDTLSYDYYCREVIIEEEKVINADMIMNAVAMASHNMKQEKVERRTKRRPSKFKKDSTANDKARPSKPNKATTTDGKKERSKDQHINQWVEDSVRQVAHESPSDEQSKDIINASAMPEKPKNRLKKKSRRVRKKKA